MINCKQILKSPARVPMVGPMATPVRVPPNVRLWEENLKVLEPLQKLGLNCSEIVNEALRENLRRHAERRIKALKAALAEV